MSRIMFYSLYAVVALSMLMCDTTGLDALLFRAMVRVPKDVPIVLSSKFVWMHVWGTQIGIRRSRVFSALGAVALHAGLSAWMNHSPAVRVYFKYEACLLKEATDVHIEGENVSEIVSATEGSRRIVNGNFVLYTTSAQGRIVVNDDGWTVISYPDTLSIRELSSSIGLDKPAVEPLVQKYGKNTFTIPKRTLMEEWSNNLKDPFSIFQILFCILWMMDDYWQWSLMSLCFILLLQFVQAFQKVKESRSLSNVLIPEIPTYVYRNSAWKPISSFSVVPGDLISISRTPYPLSVDALILKGSAVVSEAKLTGESVPIIKASILSVEDACELPSVIKCDSFKTSLLYGGSVVLSNEDGGTPDGGCIARVIRTGFGTTQGNLVHRVIHSEGQLPEDRRTPYILIGILLFIAMACCLLMIYLTWNDTTTDRWDVALRVTIIITAVIPPEMPITVSLVTNSALLRLRSLYITCSDPPRMQYVGNTTLCVFDKTGTLTSGNMVLSKILPKDPKKGSVSVAGNAMTALIVCACNSLVTANGCLQGDPMEISCLKRCQGTMVNNVVMFGNEKAHILKRYPFTSDARRTTVIVRSQVQLKDFVLVKGAPERVAELLHVVPPIYKEIQRDLENQGFRVLALAARQIVWKDGTSRSIAEKGLIHYGFIALDNPLQPGAPQLIADLTRGGVKSVMLTGDSQLAATHVAKKLKMPEPLNSASGDDLLKLTDEELSARVPDLSIVYRASPAAKERVLRAAGGAATTMMVGDGSNDMGALKCAHAGLAIQPWIRKLPANMETGGDMSEMLSDASVVAPFTCTTVLQAGQLLRYGRSTAATVNSIYRQLFLNSILTGVSLASLGTLGIRLGDTQLMIENLLMSAMSISTSRTEPSRTLSPMAVPAFFSTWKSMVLQACVHLGCGGAVVMLVSADIPKGSTSLLPFHPSGPNTAIYNFMATCHVSALIWNIPTTPFCAPRRANKVLLVAASTVLVSVALTTLNVIPPLTNLLSLVPLGSKKWPLLLIYTLDFVVPFFLS